MEESEALPYTLSKNETEEYAVSTNILCKIGEVLSLHYGDIGLFFCSSLCSDCKRNRKLTSVKIGLDIVITVL